MIRLTFIAVLVMSTSVLAQHFPNEKDHPPTMEELFTVKETFSYEVKYGFFKLGWVYVTLLSDTTYNGDTHKHMFTEMKSNSGIPFMGKELDQFHSLFYVNDDGLPVESLYWRDNVDENKFDDIRYVFDREAGIVHYKEEDDTRDTLDLEEPATSGHVIFYFSRLFAGTDEDFKLPVYVTKKAGYIFGENSTDIEERKYSAFDEPVQAYLMNGSTENIEGPFGFSGNFRAWFLADDLRVPLEARVKVFLGNVIVRIIDYTREEL